VKVASHGSKRTSGNLMMYYIDPVTEKRVARSTGTTDRDNANRKAAVWEDELNSGRYFSPNKITWEEFRTRYEEEKLASLAEGTQEAAATALNHFERLIDPAKLSAVTSAVMSRFQSKLREEKREKETIRRQETTIDGILGHLRAAFNWSVSVGMMHRLPDMHRPKRAKGRKLMRGRPITTEEFERMLGKTAEAMTPKPNKRRPNPKSPSPKTIAAWKHYLTGLWLSGLRLAESLILSWNDDSPFFVDLSGKRPRFRIYCEAEKGHQDRLLPMTPDFASFLFRTPEAERHGRVFTIDGAVAGKAMTEKRVSRKISAIGKAANVVVNKTAGKYASAHDLRRCFGTRWAKKVMPAVLQQLMRHASIDTTMAYYVDVDADDVADQLWRDHDALTSPWETETSGSALPTEPAPTLAPTPSENQGETESEAPIWKRQKPR
jgi:integrase